MGCVLSSERPRVLVVGSCNVDLVVTTPRLPAAGETVTGTGFGVFMGGKGANQAIAAARLGADTTLIARLGGDTYGKMLHDLFVREGIDERFIVEDQTLGTGVAAIVLEPDGNNRIIIVPQANAALTAHDVEAAEKAIASADVLLMQLEVPLEPLQTAAAIARRERRQVLLNPAPAQRLPDSLLGLVDIVVANETETQTLTGLSSDDDSSLVRAARSLLMHGPRAVVLTLGARGALLVNEELAEFMPAHRVDAVDTTGAGDAFCGALAAALARQQDLVDAVRFANAAGALATTRLGAEPSMPTASEVAGFLASNKAAHAEEQRT